MPNGILDTMKAARTSIRLDAEKNAREFVRKGSVLVFTGSFTRPITSRKIAELLESDREERTAGAGKLRKK